MLEGEAVLRPLLTASAAQFSTVTAGEVAASLAGLVSDVDRAAMTGELEEVMASRLRLAAADEVDGWMMGASRTLARTWFGPEVSGLKDHGKNPILTGVFGGR